jgi:hypothetical protein
MKHGAWREEEIIFLCAQWKVLDDAALAQALGRTMGRVAAARLRLGLKRPRVGGGSDRYTRLGREP